SASGCPPVEDTATSNETQVRVDGISKIIAMALPARRVAYRAGSALPRFDRSRRYPSSSEDTSTMERKWRPISGGVYTGLPGPRESPGEKRPGGRGPPRPLGPPG